MTADLSVEERLATRMALIDTINRRRHVIAEVSRKSRGDDLYADYAVETALRLRLAELAYYHLGGRAREYLPAVYREHRLDEVA